jgi:predicted transposase/invertase (TIGR01784 family)
LTRTQRKRYCREVIKMDKAISKAQERFDFVIQDKDFLRNYEMREMVLSDWTSRINDAKEEGHLEEKIEIAKNSINEGLPIEIIQRITGLDLETIESLKHGG